jgi:hypothetical protein
VAGFYHAGPTGKGARAATFGYLRKGFRLQQAWYTGCGNCRTAHRGALVEIMINSGWDPVDYHAVVKLSTPLPFLMCVFRRRYPGGGEE